MRTISTIRFLRDERGNNLIEFAMLLPMFMVLILGAVDFGRYYYLAMEVAGAAQAAVEYGMQDAQSSVTGNMTTEGKNSAQQVTTSNAGVSSNITVTTAAGCECSDGSNYTTSGCSTATASSLSCSYNLVYVVKATASASFTPIVPWHGVVWGTASPAAITISNTAEMRSGSY